MPLIPDNNVLITHIGGPTALIEMGGLRILTDPTFDEAGKKYPSGTNFLRKTRSPALDLEELGKVDVVLLSHDHHPDNLDLAGRALLPQVEHVLTTPMGAQRLGGQTRGVSWWEKVKLPARDGSQIRVTATPARHGPEDLRPAIGDVNGWIVEWDGQRHGALYISGDTVLFDELDKIVQRYKIGCALLHFGAAQVASTGSAFLTFTGVEGASFVKTMNYTAVIPIHYESWEHFTEGRTAIEQAFAAAGLEEQLIFLRPGRPILMDA